MGGVSPFLFDTFLSSHFSSLHLIFLVCVFWRRLLTLIRCGCFFPILPSTAAKTQAELVRKWMVLAETIGEGIGKGEGLELAMSGAENGLLPTAKAPGWRELHHAARNGDLRLVKQLLKRGASTNSR